MCIRVSLAEKHLIYTYVINVCETQIEDALEFFSATLKHMILTIALSHNSPFSLIIMLSQIN